MTKKLLLTALSLIAIGVFISAAPDLKRYMKMSRM
jgi:hypothetical protein